MRKRSKMPRGKSRSDFKRKSGVHPKNLGMGTSVMRGGIRL